MRQTKLWMLAAILTFCGAMTLQACANDDNSSTGQPTVERIAERGALLMRQGQDDLLALAGSVIAQMKADGTLRQLHKKYGLVYGY